MKDSISQFGSAVGRELIQSFKETRLQDSLGSGIATIALESSVFESRKKVWDSSSFGLSNMLSNQLTKSLDFAVSQNSSMEPVVSSIKLNLSQDSDLDGCFVEDFGTAPTLSLSVESRVSVYKCKSLQELALADYVLKFSLESTLSEASLQHWLGLEEDGPVPVVLVEHEFGAAGAKKGSNSKLLDRFLSHSKVMEEETALAIFNVFCGFRLAPGQANKNEVLCEVLFYKGKRFLLVVKEALSLEHFAREVNAVKLTRDNNSDTFSEFWADLSAYETKYLKPADYTTTIPDKSYFWGYANLAESKRRFNLFALDNQGKLNASHLASAPLKSWLAR